MGVERSHTPDIAVLMLHPGCNMTCTFCVTDNTMQTIPAQMAEAALARMRARGICNVGFGGGEPLAWPHGLPGIAAVAKSLGFFVQVGTNGVELSEALSASDAVDRFVLPLDAAQASLHNRLRRFRDYHHETVVKRLEQLKRQQKSVTISTVVTAANLDSLAELGGMLADYQMQGGCLHAWHLYKFIPHGRGGLLHASELGISLDDFNTVCAPLKIAGYPFRVFKRPDMFHSRSVDFYWWEGDQLCIGSECWDSASRNADETGV